MKTNSFMLFGARAVGKTTLIHELLELDRVKWINLLEVREHDRYLADPDLLKRQVTAERGDYDWVVIDEIQKIPKLLDVVHDLIESTKVKFALSGSSARKLRAGGANLLAGRAFVYNLFPLSSEELGNSFDLNHALAWGTLPKIYSLTTTEEKERYLETYALSYLREEVWNEHLIRVLEPFRRFLEVAAQSSGRIVNFSNLSEDVGVDEKTIKNYFSILEETLLGFFLEPYHTSIRKRQGQSPKFYMFDLGVIRAFEKTLQLPITERTYGYGRLFEHFIIQEAIRLNEYKRKKYSFFYLRIGESQEIDLIVERPGQPLALIEIKSSNRIVQSDLKTIESLQPNFKKSEAYLLSLDPVKQKFGKITCLPWSDGLREIGL